MKTSFLSRTVAFLCAPLLLAFAAASAPAQSFRSSAEAHELSDHARMMGFGSAVAVSENAVFVGEPGNLLRPGIVYVYREGDDGAWHEVAQLKAPDAFENDGFGTALAVDDGTLVVTASAHNDGAGAAYVFRREVAGEWELVGQLAPGDITAEDGFGASVALDRGVVLVGAPTAGGGTGAVYAFRRTDAGVWSIAGTLAPSGAPENARFGAEVALEGERALIGAPRRDGGAGVAYVFEREAGEWHETDILAVGLRSTAHFGAALALEEGRALVGAPRWARSTGAVFAFRLDEGTGEWRMDGRLLAFDGGPGSAFGSSIATAGGGLWVGAPGAGGGRGAVYIIEHDRDLGEWMSARKLMPEQRIDGRAAFGAAVGVQDGVAVVGLASADHGAGKAMILEPAEDEPERWVTRVTLMSERAALEAVTGHKVECRNGRAAGFECHNVNLVAFLPIPAIGGGRGIQLNDIWGWTDPKTGHRYALVGRTDGTAFVDITNPTNPVYVGELPLTPGAHVSAWRDIKTYENHAFIVADGAGPHGMQVFDLTRLRNYSGEPITFDADTVYHKVASVHNIAINDATGFAYLVGAGGGGITCGGGLHMVNIQQPENPEFAGCFADERTGRAGTGYTHDAQCVIYHGPDEEYQGREICFGYNETGISIADVTNKDNPVAISVASYPDAGYVHQGWLTEDHRYILSNDELDELQGTVQRTRTLIWDVTNLDDPQLVATYYGTTGSIDHNLYIRDGLAFESNYAAGLQILDISDPTDPEQVGFFDVAPFSPDDEPAFTGTWSNYPFFDNGVIPVTSIEYGLFLLEFDPDQPVS